MMADSSPRTLLRSLTRRLEDVRRNYEQDNDRPLPEYAAIVGAYAGSVALVSVIARLRHQRPPATISPWDVVLIAAATNKYSRLLAKDPVTSPFRAPFTHYKGVQASAELSEDVQGHGAQHAVGELVSCPFCLGQWVATALVAGLVLSPGITRLAAATGTALLCSDVLHYLYTWLQKTVE